MLANGIIYDIKDGPTLDEILEVFKSFKPNNHLFKVTLRYGDKGDSIPILARGFKITRIEYANGSNHKFGIEGFCEACLTKTQSTASEAEIIGRRFLATYDTEKKMGKIHFG